MYDRLAHFFYCTALKYGAVQQEDQELYEYGFSCLFSQLFSWTSMVVVALLMGVALPAIGFTLLFIPLRSYAGGRHAASYSACYLASLVICVVQFWLCSRIADVAKPWMIVGVTLLATAVLFLKVPVADPNKPADAQEILRYARTTRGIVCLELLIIGAVAYGTRWTELAVFLASAPVLVCILVLLPARKEETTAQ